MGLLSRWTRPAWEKQRERADRAYAAGRWADARHDYVAALTAAPAEVADELRARNAECGEHLAAANLEQARRYRAAGDAIAAADHYRLFIDFTEDETGAAEAREAIAELHREAHRSAVEKQAMAALADSAPIDDVQTFDLLLGRHDDDVIDAYHALGDSFRAAFLAAADGEVARALPELRRIAKDTDAAVAWYELGRALVATDDAEGALDAMLRAEAKRPGWTEPRLDAARVCWSLRRFELCEEILQRAVDDDDENIHVYFAVATTAALTRQPDYGIEALDAAAEFASPDPSIDVLRARLHELKGSEEQAARVYEDVLRRTWRFDEETGELEFHVEAALLALLSYMRRGTRLTRADELARHLLSVMPVETAWRVELDRAAILAQQGNQADADAIIERIAATAGPSSVQARLRVAKLRGDADGLSALEASLDDVQRGHWAEVCADRGW